MTDETKPATLTINVHEIIKTEDGMTGNPVPSGLCPWCNGQTYFGLTHGCPTVPAK